MIQQSSYQPSITQTVGDTLQSYSADDRPLTGSSWGYDTCTRGHAHMLISLAESSDLLGHHPKCPPIPTDSTDDALHTPYEAQREVSRLRYKRYSSTDSPISVCAVLPQTRTQTVRHEVHRCIPHWHSRSDRGHRLSDARDSRSTEAQAQGHRRLALPRDRQLQRSQYQGRIVRVRRGVHQGHRESQYVEVSFSPMCTMLQRRRAHRVTVRTAYKNPSFSANYVAVTKAGILRGG